MEETDRIQMQRAWVCAVDRWITLANGIIDGHLSARFQNAEDLSETLVRVGLIVDGIESCDVIEKISPLIGQFCRVHFRVVEVFQLDQKEKVTYS